MKTTFVISLGFVSLISVVAPCAVAQPITFTRMDSLFITAATGEPRFQAARDSAEAALRARDTATLAWLVTRVARADRPRQSLTPRQNHYVERLFTVIADSGRNPLSTRVLARAIDEAAHDTLRARWLYIGSRLGDTAFRSVARPWLHDPSEGVRRMAVRSLGAYPHVKHPSLLWAGLDTVRGLERHMRLWALAEQPVLKSLPVSQRGAVLKRLAPLLADEHLYNRQKVRDMMLKASDSSWTTLKPFMLMVLDPRVRREWWLLAREAKDGGTFLKSERAKMTVEDRRFFGE